MGLLNRIRKAGPPPSNPDALPLSVTGRGHVDGFLQLEELNVALQGRQGLEVFDRMYRTDGDVSQVVRLVVNPIVAGTWEVSPAGGSQASEEEIADAEFVRWALFENMTPNLRGHLQECLPVLFRSGFAPFEKVWEVTEYDGEQVTVPRALQLRLPRTIYRWKQDAWGALEAVEQYLPVPRAQVIAGPNIAAAGNPVLQGPSDTNSTGIDNPQPGPSTADTSIITDTRMPDYRQTVWIPSSCLVYYRIGAEGDNWEGQSMLRPAYKHWLFKDSIERMDAIAQEREALGIPVCYPPLGATDQQMDAMETVLSNIRTNSQGYVLMPGPKAAGTSSGGQLQGGWLLEWLSTGEKGSGRDPQPSLTYHTNKIAAAFIAEFLRTGTALTGGGSGREAPFEQDPFLLSVEGFTTLIEEIIMEQLVAPIMAYNRPNAKTCPRVHMSLVDTTTISELADFILKLVQVGALLPDQTLEDFLRDRADLPPADPEVVANRGDLDDALRREVMMGKNGGAGGGTPAGTNGPAGSTTGGSQKGTKGQDNRTKTSAAPKPAAPAPPPSAHDVLTQRAIKKDKGTTKSSDSRQHSADDYVEEPPYLPDSERIRWRPAAAYELACDLDGIEDHMDGLPQRAVDAANLHIGNIARDLDKGRPTSHEGMHQSLCQMLESSYNYGAQTVSDEIERKSSGLGYQLASFVPSRAHWRERGELATTEVLDSMYHAHQHAKLAGHSPGRAQRAAEKAAVATLKKVGRTHGLAAFNQGRNERILDAIGGDSPQLPGWGFVYTAILDQNTCGECADADDGRVRPVDDPWLLDHTPPNPHCESTASQTGNQCRCFLIAEPLPQ